jgi:hypothetical protein
MDTDPDPGRQTLDWMKIRIWQNDADPTVIRIDNIGSSSGPPPEHIFAEKHHTNLKKKKLWPVLR